MRKHILILFLIIISFHIPCRAQFEFKAQTAFSYIEHFSTGLSFEFSGKRNISILYGSNFFIKPNSFSSYMLQYERYFNKVEFAGITPELGIKGGYSVFTDKYYRWTLFVIVPFAGLSYRINDYIDLAFDFGIAYSRELSLKRVGFGNIGNYKEFLPELKLTLYYKLNR